MRELYFAYESIDGRDDILYLFDRIRTDMEDVSSRHELTDLYKRALYLITLAHSATWDEKFGEEAPIMREITDEEFLKTADFTNLQAEKLGTAPNYDRNWTH
jgi:hypothetical protein